MRGSSVVSFRIAPVTCLAILLAMTGMGVAQEKVTFDDHIKPLFRQRCAACHNPDKKSGDLDVTNYTNLMLGGGSGEVIAPGDVGGSYLFALVNHDDEPAMPPDSDRIPDNEVSLLKGWIEQGALENQSSKARMSNKPKVAALDESPLERPAVVVQPAHLSLEPLNVVERANALTAMHTSPWAPIMALAGPGQVQLYSLVDRQLIGILDFPEGKINALRFSRNGSLLMGAGGTAGVQGIVAIWDVASGERLATLDEEVDAILAADLSPDQQRVVVGGPQRMVRVYLTGSGELAFEIKKHTEWITATAFSPDGVLVATADRNGGIHVWESFTGREYLKLDGHGAAVTGLSWRTDSNILASCSEDGTVKLWEMENGGQVRNWNAHGGGVQAVEFTRDGRLVSTGRDRVGKLWDQAGQQIVAFGGLADIGTAVTHCDETNQIVVGDWAGNAIVFAADGNETGRLEVTPPALQTRTELAQQAVQMVQTRLMPEMAKKQEMDKQLSELQQQLTTTTNTLMEKQKSFEAETATQANEQKMLETLTAENQALAGRIVVLEKALPGLQQAQLKLAEANAAAPEDTQLATLSENAAQLLQARQQQLETDKKLAGEQQTQIAAFTKSMGERQALLTNLQKEIEQLVANQTQLDATQTTMVEQTTKQNEVVAAIQAEHVAAVNRLERWKAEQQFVAQMQQNLKQYEETEQAWFVKLEERDAAETALKEVQSRFDAKANQVSDRKSQADTQQMKLVETMKAGEALQQSLATLAQEQKSLQESQTKMSQGIAALGEAVKNAASALELSGEDAELAAAVKQLTDLQTAKNAELEALNQTIVTTTEKHTTATAQYEENQTQAAQLKASIDELLKQHAALEAELATLQQELNESTARHQALGTQADELNAKLEELEKQRKALQGISA